MKSVQVFALIKAEMFFCQDEMGFFFSLKNKKQNNPKNKNTVLCTSSAEHESSCSLVLVFLMSKQVMQINRELS